MRSLRYTLFSDGASDRCLLPIIDWIFRQFPLTATTGIAGQVADLRNLKNPPSVPKDRLRLCLQYYPCDVLFVHRDAERFPREERVNEIERLVEGTGATMHVPVVPVRMTEAWLLIDEKAIREAADNPNGSVALDLPALDRLERTPNPKSTLEKVLETASEKTGRRLDQFRRDLNHRKHRVVQFIRDFSPLRRLPAFSAFEQLTHNVVERLLRD